MENLPHVSCGWSWLERQLNRFVDCINARGVIPSATVAVQETPAGCVLSVMPVGQGNQDQQQQGSGVVWQGVGWMTVTVVDPGSCTQTTIEVLTKQPGNSIQIQAG